MWERRACNALSVSDRLCRHSKAPRARPFGVGWCAVRVFALVVWSSCSGNICGRSVALTVQPAVLDWDSIPEADRSLCAMVSATLIAECWQHEYLHACGYPGDPALPERVYVELTVDGMPAVVGSTPLRCSHELEAPFVLMPAKGLKEAPPQIFRTSVETVDGGARRFALTYFVQNPARPKDGATKWCGSCFEFVEPAEGTWINVSGDDDEKMRQYRAFQAAHGGF